MTFKFSDITSTRVQKEASNIGSELHATDSWLHFLLHTPFHTEHTRHEGRGGIMWRRNYSQCWTYGMKFHQNIPSKGEHLSGSESFISGASGSVVCCDVRWRVLWWISILFTCKRIVYTVGLWGWKLVMGKCVRINSLTVELSLGLTSMCFKMEKEMMRTSKSYK